MRVGFGVLGPVAAWDGTGTPIDVKGPRHRAVLARLIVARGQVVPVGRLVDDLWPDAPPPGAVAAIRTFVAALRRALEPDRPPRTPARLLVTDGPGYALRAAPDAVDAWRFAEVVAGVADAPPSAALARLDEALGWWRGPAYADFDDATWAVAARTQLEQLRMTAIERRGRARLALGHAADAVPELDAHAVAHPWREEAWRLLALALYRADRQGDALAVLRRARHLLREQLGIDPGPRLRRLETDILRQTDSGPDADSGSGGEAGRVWARATAAYDRAVAGGAVARLESTVGLLRSLAVAGPDGLTAAREQRLAAITAAERLGDPELTARVIGGYDVPAIWTRSDDPEQAARIVAAAERALSASGPQCHEATRARLLATIAVESRGTNAVRAGQAARQAERLARDLGDPALLAFALNGVFMQGFERTGLAARRDGIGAELVTLSARHGLASFEILGHLVRMQARGALADFAGADEHATAADRLAARYERPLAGVFTAWYRALRLAATGAATPVVEAAYADAAGRLAGAGMPGVRDGLLPLALLCLRVARGEPLTGAQLPDGLSGTVDWGPYRPWTRPLTLLASDRAGAWAGDRVGDRSSNRAAAAVALRQAPDPPGDLLSEALWCLLGQAAIQLGDRDVLARVHAALAPAAGELAGAGSGMLTVGPVSRHLAELSAALGARPLSRTTGV